ncbi:MAG: TetR/AcrR family transcriptional regulator, partial [Pseudomonadota bacterium]
MARPKEFDPDDALEKAMHQFWSKGYFDTSIRDLIDRTGVNYYGLYGEFGNKHGLFLAALDRYRDTVTAEALKELDGPGSIHETILRMFGRLSELTRTPDGRVGCLMCNTAVEVAPTDEDAAAKVKAHRKLIEKALTAALTRAKDKGEIAAD